MLQNDIERESGNGSFVVPKTPNTDEMLFSPGSPKSAMKSRFRAGSSSGPSSDYIQQFRRKFVSYDEFLTSYWVHLPQTLTRSLGEGTWFPLVFPNENADPALVFGEIIGVIKGSEETVGTKERCLDREAYKSLSCRTQGMFAHKRDEIYDLFMAYTKLKYQQQDFDSADRWVICHKTLPSC